MTSLNGKVVFITGGARGIGAEVARRLRNKGAKLVLTDLDKGELDAVAAELGEDRGLTVIASYGSVLHIAPEAFKRVLDINLLGVFHTARATLPALIERRGYLLIV